MGRILARLAPTALVVKPEFAIGQFEAEGEVDEGDNDDSNGDGPGAVVVSVFRGAVELGPERPARDLAQVSREVLDHLISEASEDISIRVEGRATEPDGFSDHVIRTVTGNARTLRSEDGSGFEEG